MLDTIILQIPEENFVITNKEAFSLPFDEFKTSRRSFLKSVSVRTFKDKMTGIYKPRITLIKRGRLIFLKIEFSAPKLIFNNNIDEISTNDFSKVLDTLQKRLNTMGIDIDSNTLSNSEVLSFHPSKNIELNQGFTASYVINELGKANITKVLDLDVKNFRNTGHALQYYSNSHSFIIYDKIADLIKPKGRATDKDKINNQMTILNKLRQQKHTPEILRLEVRLSKKRKMNQILQKINYPINPQFKDLFDKNLNKKIIAYYWDHLFLKNLFLFASPNDPQQIFHHMISDNPKMKITEAFRNLGMIYLCKDQDGIRGLRNIVEKNKSKTNWQVVDRYLKQLNNLDFQQSSYIHEIRQQIDKFSTYRINSPNKM